MFRACAIIEVIILGEDNTSLDPIGDYEIFVLEILASQEVCFFNVRECLRYTNHVMLSFVFFTKIVSIPLEVFV